MNFDMNTVTRDYEATKDYRELGKWIFSIATLGLGGLYLWATTTVIREGEIGLRRSATGKMVLLPPGRHSNFPWESYPTEPQALSNKTIQMGPYQIITVDTGFVAETYNRGRLEILAEGQHLIADASHTFEGFIPTKQETKKLHQVTASTRDNVGLVLHADVRYQIVSPETAVTQIDDIENSIKEIAEISISQVVSHHSLSDFAPAVSAANFNDSHENHGIGDVIRELSRMITEQLSRLGIQLINIGITSWKINDANLAHELAQGAVVISQAQSKLMAAENAAQVKRIETDAEGKAITSLATAKAQAIATTGDAYRKFAEDTKDCPSALAIFQKAQEVDMVSRAKHTNLFFQASGTGQLPPVVATVGATPQ